MKNVFIAAICCIMVLSGCCGSTSNSCQKDANSCCSTDKDSLLLVMNLHRKVKPEFVSAFKASFEKCKTSTMSEPACLDYGMYQSYTDSTVFFIAETWQNKAGHRQHMETPHLKLHLQEIEGMADPSGESKNTEIYVCPQVN